MLMGTGNLTELTDADSSGVTALLRASARSSRSATCWSSMSARTRSARSRSTTRPPHHVCRAPRRARCRAAITPGCCRSTTASLSPQRSADIEALAAEVRDANFRIMTAEDGIHVFNGRGPRVAQDAFALFPGSASRQDGAHAFYLGAELTKAEIAWRLGKRYAQDEPLAWGVGGACSRRPTGRGWRKPGTRCERRRRSDRCRTSARRIVTTVDRRRQGPHRAARHHRREGRLGHRAVPAVDDARQSGRACRLPSPIIPTTCASSPAA